MIYQLKKLEKGLEINSDTKLLNRIAQSSLSGTIGAVEVEDNFVIVVNNPVITDSVNVKVVHGQNKGREYKVHKSMLKDPNLLPCFRKKEKKWCNCVNMLENGKLPASIGAIVKNALSEDTMSKVKASLNSDNKKDKVISIKVLQETLEPYLGVLGLVMALDLIKSRVLNNDEV